MAVSQRERRGASAAAIRHHYDVGNEFWALWLDETMTYSGALWADGDTLTSAQARKLDHLIECAGASAARRVLDVGCGWGSLLRRLVDRHAVDVAVGLTLSDAQAEWIRGWSDPRCEVLVESWTEHEPAEPYDAIVSIGAIEHFAQPHMSRAEKVATYRDYFQRCHDWLEPGGRTSLQTIALGNVRPTLASLADTRFVGEVVYRESYPPRISEVLEAAEGLFAVESVGCDGAHYARTCRAWARRLREARESAVEVMGEELVERYERYLEACVRQFADGHTELFRLGLRWT